MTTAAASTADIRALQAALTAENAAVYGYGVAGAHLAGARQKEAAQDWAAHEATRDTLAAMITAQGDQPTAAAAAYRLPFPVRNGQAAIMLAAFLEDRVTAAYLGLVALSDARLRAFGARAADFPFAHGARHGLKAGGPSLFDSYHCSRYNTNTGVLTDEMFRGVFASIRAELERF